MNIVISGMTCSGKTTLSNMIKDEFKDVSIMHQDDYYKDLNDIPKARGYYLMDSPNAFHTLEFTHDAGMLDAVSDIVIPTYDISKNKRISKNKILRSSKINIFEGLHTISLLQDIKDINIFLNIDIETCIERRIKRDNALVHKDKIEEYFKNVILPLYKSYIEPQKENADIIIERTSDINCLLKKLANY